MGSMELSSSQDAVLAFVKACKNVDFPAFWSPRSRNWKATTDEDEFTNPSYCMHIFV